MEPRGRVKYLDRTSADAAPPRPPSQGVTTDISPLTPLTLLLMTSMPEAHPLQACGPAHPREPSGRFSSAADAARGNLGIRSFPSRRDLFPRHYCIPREEEQELVWPPLFPVSISSPRPGRVVALHSLLASFSSVALSLRCLRCSCRR